MAKRVKKEAGREPEEFPKAGGAEQRVPQSKTLMTVARPHYGRGHPKLSVVRRDFLQAFENSFGNISTACLAAGIHRQTFYRWMQSESRINRKFQKRVRALRAGEMRLDYLEGKLMQLVAKGNAGAVIFALKTLGKDRGYVERAAELEYQLARRAVDRLEAVIERQLTRDPAFKPDIRRFAELAAADFGVRAEVIEKEFHKRGGKGEKGRQGDRETRRQGNGTF